MHEYSPWISVGYNQRELERITKLLFDIICETRRLKEAGILDGSEFVTIRHLMLDKLHILERIADQEVERMLEEMTKQRNENRESKQVPDPK